MFIYKITNTVNNKIYVGKTTQTIEQRFKEHKKNVKADTKQSKLYSAMKHYGVNNFIIEELDTATSTEELNEKEKYWIKELNSRDSDIGYNISAGGDGGATWSPKGTITINNGVKNKQIKPEELDTYLAEGWVKGGKPAAKRPNTGKWVNNGIEQKRVQPEELSDYLAKGWELGYSDKGKSNLSKSHKGQAPSNKGSKLTAEDRKIVSELTKQAMNTPEMKAKMSAIYESRKGSKWMVKGSHSLLVKKEDIQYYIDNGYVFGRKGGGIYE